MKFNIQKYYYKLFDNKKYKKLKQQNLLKKSVELFENKYRDYLDMARVIKACKFFIVNQSVAYPMAEALKVPRILEAEPNFPVVQPIGKNAFDFYYQPHFEKWCEYLNNKF